ncbi:MAG TPA: hypothetical protein VMF13_14185 [Luteitalea sp.]|nr:hypothetical protein [Luteitalea sp.]
MALLASWLCAPAPSAQAPLSRDSVVDRLAQYAERFGHELQGIVARERYVQTIRATRGRPSLDADALTGQVLEERRLLSSLLLVHEAATPWQLHRDVLAVDDQPLADREDRLARLFGGPQAGTPAPAVIADESARYNLGRFVRNINIPTFPLIVIHPTRRERFRFRDRGHATVGGASVRLLTFEERGDSRTIRGTRGYDVVLRGSVAVDPLTGDIVRAAIEPRAHRLEPRLVVHFARVAGVALPVPVRLLESYWREGDETYVAGEATYDEFRRYGTDVGVPVVR